MSALKKSAKNLADHEVANKPRLIIMYDSGTVLLQIIWRYLSFR